jgi:phosphoribosylformylglycinamidine synthase
VAISGATPVAATNCLNFGNPEKPEIMAQFSAAIDGMAAACTALGTPITGGNVSFYNETKGEGIYPTPVVGIVGILDGAAKAASAHFQKAGDAILLLWPVPRGEAPDPNLKVPSSKGQEEGQFSAVPGVLGDEAQIVPEEMEDSEKVYASELSVFGSSEFAKVVLGSIWGAPPPLDLDAEADLHTLLEVLAGRKLLNSARDISDGGIAVALAQASFANSIGATVEQEPSLMVHPLFGLFAEPASTVLVAADPGHVSAIEKLAGEYSFFASRIGATGGSRLQISVYGDTLIDASIDDLRRPWASALESALHDEVSA